MDDLLHMTRFKHFFAKDLFFGGGGDLILLLFVIVVLDGESSSPQVGNDPIGRVVETSDIGNAPTATAALPMLLCFDGAGMVIFLV